MNKFLPKIILVALMVLSLSGCDMVYGLIDKEGAEEKKIIGKILPYEPNQKVHEAQTLLKLYGYSIGIPDGVLGGRTRDIIEKFQKDAGLKPTRFIDKATWQELHVFEMKGLVRDDELNVKAIQDFLKKSGFNPGSVDGSWGPKTQKAVVEFQKKNGLPADGKIGYKTLKALAGSTEGH